MQRALKDSNDRLEDRVAEKTLQLSNANKRLNNALSEIKRLKNQLQEENAYLKEEIKQEHNFDEIICQSEGLLKTLGMWKK